MRAHNLMLAAARLTRSVRQGMLWRIPDSNHHFVGSIHGLPADDATIPSSVWSLLPQVDYGVFECDFAHPCEPVFARYRDGRTLSDEVPAAIYAQALERWREFEIQIPIDSCRPWWAAQLISIIGAVRSGVSIPLGADMQIFNAMPDERRLVLEGPEALLAFENAPMHEQIFLLNSLSRSQEAPYQDYLEMFEAWRSADLEKVTAILEDRMQKMPSIYSALTAERNRVWLPKIAELLQRRRSGLFVLGIMHFVGAASIPTLLQDHHGILLERIE